ncbi:pyridoxal phosphate-dependent transferase [Aspergillus karnatakaensis]|uniref:pyridoxal phosphate-dependent transferase n=1 Tax=Aspergillus karnatakaensis TaxID=1810916 RepID=UPI003CCCD8E0
MLSSRGKKSAGTFDIPWKYMPAPTYHKEKALGGLISFALAEHGPARDDIADYINNNVKFTTNSVCYGSMSTDKHRLPAAAAAHINKYFSPLQQVTPENIVRASGCSAAGNMLSYALTEPGDGVLVSRPVYGRFELDYGLQGDAEVVYADTETYEAFTPDSIAKYEEALKESEARGVKIRALLLVNPHNPVGRCYPKETLIQILKFCNKHQIHLVSDEIYALCVFDSGDPDAHPFVSVLSLATPELIDQDLVHVLYGFSKDFASGGLHLGFVVTHNTELRRALLALSRFHYPSSAVDTIGIAILEDEEFITKYTEKSRADLAFSYRIATSILDQEGIKYIRGVNAGFFLYIDLSPYLPTNESLGSREREYAIAKKLLDNGLFLHPGEEHCKDAGWFRLVYSHSEDVLREGLRRLLKTIKQQ